MGLRIIYGRAGTGKSEFIYNEINQKKNNNKVYIITPEQFSFTAEQKLMKDRKSAIGVEVVTFNRLAYRVQNEIGGCIHNTLTKCGKAMIIYSILQKKKVDLKFLNKTDENIELCMRIITELKKHGITENDLLKESEKIENRYLKSKINDILIIYSEFQKMIKNNYIDETDLLTHLAENIDKVDLLKDSIIYIDEFSGFTEQEYIIIKKLVKISKNISITMCADDLNFNTNPDIDIFYPNKITLKKIINLLDEKDNIEKIKLDKVYRFKNEELNCIERYLFDTKTKECKTAYNINLFLAKNYYSEIENIAKKITKKIKEKNIRYRDISIITKNIGDYSSLARTIFKKYNIPIFIDEKRELTQNIIVQYVLSIIEIINKNFSYESVFNYIKMGFTNVEDIYKFENYCIKYGIKNSKFLKDFNYGINEKNKEEIGYINELRKKIINPLVELKNKIEEEKSAKNISKQIYLFLKQEDIENKINLKIKELNKKNYIDISKEYEESYKIIINILDEITLVFKEEKVTLEKFGQILKIGLKNSGLGKIPGTQDQVILGDIDRSRSRKTKIVFILGLNDGVFPSINKNEGFLDDEDREILKNNGIEIAKGTLENLYDDKYNIYKAFTTAENELYLSYASSDNEGKSLRASNLIFRIKKLFPNIKEESNLIDRDNRIEIINETKLYEDLILKINEINNNVLPDRLFYIVFKYFKQNEKYNKLLSGNLNYIHYKFFENISENNINKLYGNNLKTSISKLEKYKSCPFSYYLQYVLNLKEKEELKIQTLDTGTFMHEVIDNFFEKIKNEDNEIKNISEEEIESIINEIIDEKLCNNTYYVFTATEKYKLLVTRLKRIIIKSIKYIIQTITQSEFKIAGTEVEFSEKGKYKPIIINIENGKTIEITGKIDRIDIARDKKEKFVRIIDYKSSIKNIDYGNIYAGLQLQLITYLDAVCKIEDLVPAGILYFSLIEQLISSNKKITEEEIERKIKNNFKMKGLILADVKVAKMQDKNLEKGNSEIIPAYIDSTGNLSNKKSSIATKEEFEKLQKFINKTIQEISKEIYKGKIEIKPYYKNKKTPCDYCTYKNMCGFNSGIIQKNYNFVNKLSKEDFLDKVK